MCSQSVSYLRLQFPLASSPVLAPLALGFSVSPAWSSDSQDPGDLPGIRIFQAWIGDTDSLGTGIPETAECPLSSTYPTLSASTSLKEALQ